ncbi:helix-turn-helix domain-containing protein [Deinococcus sedimenti]|nr:helix-turn-helix transcriptional regulator [Deinococcus sedimenti]
MKEDGMTQEAVAQQMNVDRVYINRMLNNGTSKIPMRWGQLLDLLGLELVIRRKQDR